MNTKSNNTAAIFARVSSSNDRQSTERQVVDLKAYADRNGLDLVKVYKEHISGAKKNAERPILMDCIAFCKENRIGILLVSELSRLGRNTFEVLSTVRDLLDSNINVYFQKEQMSLLDTNGKPSMFTPILIATLGTCAALERENIQYRLNSGRRVYIEKGGLIGRRKGSVKSKEKKEEEYKDVLAYLRKNYKIADVAKLTGTSTSTVQRLKNEFRIR